MGAPRTRESEMPESIIEIIIPPDSGAYSAVPDAATHVDLRRSRRGGQAVVLWCSRRKATSTARNSRASGSSAV